MSQVLWRTGPKPQPPQKTGSASSFGEMKAGRLVPHPAQALPQSRFPSDIWLLSKMDSRVNSLASSPVQRLSKSTSV